jgi:hypothetical protein
LLKQPENQLEGNNLQELVKAKQSCAYLSMSLLKHKIKSIHSFRVLLIMWAVSFEMMVGPVIVDNHTQIIMGSLFSYTQILGVHYTYKLYIHFTQEMWVYFTQGMKVNFTQEMWIHFYPGNVGHFTQGMCRIVGSLSFTRVTIMLTLYTLPPCFTVFL